MSSDMDFFIYLLESYAQAKGLSAAAVLRRWDELGISDAIFNNYWIYHTEALENAFEDIDSLTATGKTAW